MKISVIDIGTNSIHAIFAEIRSAGVFHVIGKDKEMVRLGDGAMVTGKLSEAAMARSLEALKRLVHLAKHRGMSRVLATATSAVRESENGGDFLDLVRREAGLKVQVITGAEEGRLIYQAVRNTIEFGDKKALILDIGGGSTEFIAGSQSEAFWIESLRLGANRLSQLFPLSDPPKKAEVKRLEEYVVTAMAPIFKRLKSQNADFAIGTSGTIASLARLIVSAEDGNGANQSLQQVPISVKAVEAKYDELCGSTLSERHKMKGLDKDRADMIVHGSAIVALLLKNAGIPKIMICDKALREGILYDFIEKNRKALKIEEENPEIRRRGVVALAAKCDFLKGHAEQTAKLALKLFDALSEVHGLTAADRELLEYAALLHDVGYVVSFHKHHKHAHYLITHSELAGFSPDEIQVIAWTARMHRRGGGKKDDEFTALAPAEQKRILRLAAILRLADALDHSHFSLVEDVKAKEENGVVRVKVFTRGDAQWEVHEALERRELFEKTFGKKLEFKSAK